MATEESAVTESQTDASETGVSADVLAAAPAFAVGVLYQSTAQALALAAQNATASQQHVNTVLEAVTAASVARMLGAQTPIAPVTVAPEPAAAAEPSKPAPKRARTSKKADNGGRMSWSGSLY